jgi:hypothetical protein
MVDSEMLGVVLCNNKLEEGSCERVNETSFFLNGKKFLDQLSE